MNLLLDAEYNDYQGELISMALAAEDGQEWYEVLPCYMPSEWIRRNVLSVLNKRSIPLREFQNSLEKFLNQFDRVHIISDWPEDIAHFCNALITGPGKKISTPQGLTFQILPMDYVSEIPHNALADAIALKESFEILRIQ